MKLIGLQQRLAMQASRRPNPFFAEGSAFTPQDNHEQARFFLNTLSPENLAPLLQRANLAESFSGRKPISSDHLQRVVQKANDRYQETRSTGHALPGHVELIKAFNEHFGRSKEQPILNRFLHEIRQTSFRAVSQQAPLGSAALQEKSASLNLIG